MTRYYLSILKQVVDSGGIIAYPTETVFGLGCRPDNYQAVLNILTIKNRPKDKGLILIASKLNQILPWIQKPNQSVWHKIKRSWPGHTSWAIPASADCPSWITGNHATVVIRVSQHPVVQTICDTLGYPIVSTSANISQQTALDSAIKVRKRFGQQVDLFVPGHINHTGAPSVIYDAQTTRQLR